MASEIFFVQLGPKLNTKRQTHFRGLQDTLYNLPNTLQTPFRLVYSPLELSGVVGGWVANTYIVMPLRGPTCKIARFQAELKFQVGPSVAKSRSQNCSV